MQIHKDVNNPALTTDFFLGRSTLVIKSLFENIGITSGGGYIFIQSANELTALPDDLANKCTPDEFGTWSQIAIYMYLY